MSDIQMLTRQGVLMIEDQLEVLLFSLVII